MAAQQVEDLGLRDYLKVIRRRKGVIVLSVLMIVVITVGVSFLQTPVYEATAEVLLQSRTSESPFDPNTGQASDPTRAVETQIKLLKSQPVRDQVRKEIGSARKVSAFAAGQTDVIEVTGSSTVAKESADIANAYATAYLDVRRKQAIDDVLAAAQQIQSKIADLQKEVDSLEGQIVNAPPSEADATRRAVQPRRDLLVQQQAVFKQKLDELQVGAALKTGGAQLASRASVPTSPVSPRPLRNAVLAGVIAFVLATALAFIIDYLDDSVKTKDELVSATAGLPVVGLIPAVPEWKQSDEPQVVSLLDPKSPAAEAYRALRTSIQFLGLERPMRIVQITSAGAQEGKTTTLCNLAVALARTGQRVIVVCCDLRRPRVHEFFGLKNDIGFTSVLLGKVPLTAALQPVPDQVRLSVLASGPLPPNPSELLSSKRTADVMTSLQAEADIVLVDSPPILPVTDALVLSGRVDATVLVCVAGSTTRKDVARAVELLQQVDAPLVGTILNGVTGEDAYGYGYGYYRYESAEARTNGTGVSRPAQVAGREP